MIFWLVNYVFKGVPNGILCLDVSYLEQIDQVDKQTRMKPCEEVKAIRVDMPSTPTHLVLFGHN